LASSALVFFALAFNLLAAGGAVSGATAFVTACGTALCIGGTPWQIHGATIYEGFGDIPSTIALAQAERLNTLHAIGYFLHNGGPADAFEEGAWVRVDAALAAARGADLHVVLDLSDYAHLLKASGQNAATADWGPFLAFVANRVNTVTGVSYRDDPTIALVALWGEADAPNGGDPLRPTTRQLTEFYRRTLAQWKALDTNHLVETGGFSYLDWESGIDWQTIMADPNSDVCAIHMGSPGDILITTPNVSAFCRAIGKPWINEAFSMCASDFGSSDEQAAAYVQFIYNDARRYRASGNIFWNLGVAVENCNLNPGRPRTFAVVRQNAP
jgi:hypothetical protein